MLKRGTRFELSAIVDNSADDTLRLSVLYAFYDGDCSPKTANPAKGPGHTWNSR